MYTGVWKTTTMVALKTATSAEGKNQLASEGEVMQQLCHTNVVRFFGLSEDDKGSVLHACMHYVSFAACCRGCT